MKTHLLKALLATILLALGLTKASAAVDPSVQHAQNVTGQMTPDAACMMSCHYLE